MRLITHKELQEILTTVAGHVVEVPSYRLGQGIYNELHTLAVEEHYPNLGISEVIKEGRQDFFYWTDELQVMQEVLEHYVEKE